MCYLSLYCIVQFHLLFNYLFKNKSSNAVLDEDDLPIVTIQLPIFNEKYVVNRLIDSIVKIDYPKDKLQIQILDDSTDETWKLSQSKVDEYKAKDFDIELVHRTIRTGFKAGALRESMGDVKGEFIAIFDADFTPDADFLKKTLPHFSDPKIGTVQTRWGHINQGYSLLTELQAFYLNVHFTVEQKGRENGRLFLQFNGTAGVWRKTSIIDAGGWEDDTLTEDLDLSYRAQLKGWKIRFLDQVTAPAELPAEMNGLKSQQYRWMKGGAETAMKILPSLWRSSLSFVQKFHGSMHLLSSVVFLFIFFLGLISIPLLFLVKPAGLDMSHFTVFLGTILAYFVIFNIANVKALAKGKSVVLLLLKNLFVFPMFLALSMGLSLHNSIAVIQGLRGKRSDFIRTPKYGIEGLKDSIKSKSYLQKKIDFVTLMEGVLAAVFAGLFLWGLISGNGVFLMFHGILLLGYGTIFFYSMKHAR